MVLARDGRTLWAVSPGYGRVVAIDVRRRVVTDAFRIGLESWAFGSGTRAALSPDGKQIAFADGRTVILLDLPRRQIARRESHAVMALGYAPDGSLRRLT
jgi:hypothetical protein